MQTLLDRTLTVTLIPTLRPTSTLTVLRQRLYCTSEAPKTIARILQPYNIDVAHKPITTLQRLLINVKGKDKPEDRQGEVSKIKCCDCQPTYIGETGRNLSMRLTEHKQAMRNGDANNHNCFTPFTDETWNRLELCDMYSVFYRLLSMTHLRQLVC